MLLVDRKEVLDSDIASDYVKFNKGNRKGIQRMQGRSAQHDKLYMVALMPYMGGIYDPDEQRLRCLIQSFLKTGYVEARIAVIMNPEAGDGFYLTREEKQERQSILPQSSRVLST